MDVSRYCGNNIEELKLDLEFVTPAFLGGADDRHVELRSSSFKGMIRFWWRALYGAKYGDKILEKESEIFGSAGITTQASNVRIEIICPNMQQSKSKQNFKKVKNCFSYHTDGKEIPINILEYLAYGKFEYRKEEHRNICVSEYILPKTKFTMNLKVNKNYYEEVINAVFAMIEFGGIGAKARNGFGSMKFCDDKKYQSLKNNFNTTIKRDREKQNYSYLSYESKWYKTSEAYNSWEEALSEIGDIYKYARSNLEGNHQFSQRGLVARPIESRIDKRNIPNEVSSKRHPKFTFLHISFDDGKYIGKILTMPILFYEEKRITDYSNMIKSFEKDFNSEMKSITNLLPGGSK